MLRKVRPHQGIRMMVQIFIELAFIMRDLLDSEVMCFTLTSLDNNLQGYKIRVEVSLTCGEIDILTRFISSGRTFTKERTLGAFLWHQV